MTLMRAPSEAVREILRALDLPPRTVALTLHIRTGQIVQLEVEMLVEAKAGEQLAKVLKRYRLQELEEPNDRIQPALGARLE